MHIAMLSYHTCPLATLGGKDTGGMNVYVRDLTRQLGRMGHHVDVFTRSQDEHVPHILHDLGYGNRVVHVPAGPEVPLSRQELTDYLPEFVKGIQEFAASKGVHYDLIHSHYWMSGIAALEAGLSPQVFTYHTVEARKTGPAGALRGLSPIRREAEERLSRECSRAVCFSEEDLARTREIFPVLAGKGTVIPPGVDDTFRDLPARGEVRKLHRIPAGAFLFLLAAREDPGKKVVSAIEAFRALRAAEGERLRLLIAGQKIPAARLPAGAACAGPVPHADMPGLYSAADAVLYPSAYESFGLVPLEGMAAGKPVIAASGGYWGDTILAEGGGLAHAPETESGLAEAMRTVFREESLRARLSEEGMRIAARFTWETCTSSWARLLSSAARPGSPR